jgi:hypothetical protein
MSKLPFFLFGLLLAAPLPAEIISDTGDQTSLSLTIYNDNLALIRDRRRVNLAAGVQELAIRGVSGRMQAETALLERRQGKGGLRVLEQNFNYDLLTPDKLLEKYLGRTIDIIRTNPATGRETRESATVLSVQEGLVVRIGNRIETNPGGRYIFRDIPDNLRDRPTLVTRLQVAETGSRELELSYLSGGLGWKADYVARLSDDEQVMGLAGWVTLSNDSGTSYADARLQLVAGEVNRVAPRRTDHKLRAMTTASAIDKPMREERLLDYHLYTLPRPTTLLNHQTKQVALLAALSVPVRKEYLLQGQPYYYQGRYGEIGHKLPVGSWLIFMNTEAARLGMPLPAGIIRVYKSDSHGNLQFVGEDRIGHTPRNETVRLKLGNAFDITATRIQTSFRKRNYGHPYSFAAETAYRIELRNAREDAVEVLVREPLPGDWQITHETRPHEQLDARTVQWRISIPPRGKSVLEYSALVKY